MTKQDSIPAPEKLKTFQELGFFGDIKKDKWNDFIRAVQNNISQSRKEQGNLSFSLFQPEDGKLQPIWFERFRDKASHNYHKQQDYFKNAIMVIQQSLNGEPQSMELEELNEIPAVVPTHYSKPKTTLHVVVLFEVRPEKRQFFIDVMAEVTPDCRQAQGNLEFNLYRYSKDPNKFVLMEGWQNQAQLKLNHIKQLNAGIEDFFVSSPIDSRWIVKDISQ